MLKYIEIKMMNIQRYRWYKRNIYTDGKENMQCIGLFQSHISIIHLYFHLFKYIAYNIKIATDIISLIIDEGKKVIGNVIVIYQ